MQYTNIIDGLYIYKDIWDIITDYLCYTNHSEFMHEIILEIKHSTLRSPYNSIACALYSIKKNRKLYNEQNNGSKFYNYHLYLWNQYGIS